MATASQFQVERNVALPDASKKAGKYPFSDLGVGDSFLAPESERLRVGASAYNFAARHGIKVSIRKVEGGIRVWRTA